MLHNNQTTKNMSDIYVKEEENINQIIYSNYSFTIVVRGMTRVQCSFQVYIKDCGNGY